MLRHLCSVILLLGFLIVGCRVEHKVQYGSLSVGLPDLNVENVDYGFSGETVNFVVIQTAHKSMTPYAHLTMEIGSGGSTLCWGYIPLPDGTRQDLPTSGCIYECAPSQFKSARITFTTSQLRAYLDSNPHPATIDGLNQFLAQKKQ